MTSSDSVPSPYEQIFATFKKLQGDAYKPLMELAASNLNIPNVVALENAAFQERWGRLLRQATMGEDMAKRIHEASRALYGVHAGPGRADWKRALLAIRDQHHSYLKELDLPSAVDGVDDVPSVAIIEEELTFALDSLAADERTLDDSATSPMGLTQREWQTFFSGNAAADILQSLDYVTPHLSLVVCLIMTLLLTQGTTAR